VSRVPRLDRDRVTWLAYAQLGLWGFFIFGFGPVVPLLRDAQGTSVAVASLHSTGIAVGTLVGGFLFPVLVRRYGRERVVWTAVAGVAAGVLLLVSARPFPATLTAVVVTCVFGAMLVTGVTATLSARHGALAPAAISEANALGAALGIASPVLIGAAEAAGLGWRWGIAAEVVLIGIVAAAAYRMRIRLPGARADRSSTRPPAGPLPGPYWLAWTLLGCTASIEVCLSLWAADVLRGHAGMSPGAAAGAVAAVMVGMFLGRLAGGRLALYVAPPVLLLGALAVSLVGFAVFWASPVPFVAVGGLVVVGLGNAVHYPLGVSMALAAAPGQADRAAAYTSYSVGIGFGAAPVLLGLFADLVRDPRTAFLLLPVFIAAAALLAGRLRRALPVPA
jgi:predicted MFS family arabinose efflux permease